MPDELLPGDDPRLARHLRNLGRMYPVLAHDLHAFLNTMVLNLELLQRAAAKEDPDSETMARIRRYAALVADEIPPLDRMLKAVVGQMRLSDAPTTRFDFRTLCEELAIVFDSYARYRRLRLKATLVDVPMAVAGDRDAMAHALTSLLLEMLEAVPQGTDLTLSLQADRRLATLALAAAPPAVLTREPAVAESTAAAREILERHGARIDDAPGADGSSALGITVPLVPLIT
jgi:signal transduction histidine kinase